MVDREPVNQQEAVAGHTRDALKWVFQVAMGASLTLASTKTIEALLYLLEIHQQNKSFAKAVHLDAVRVSQEVLSRYNSSTDAWVSIACFIMVFFPSFLRFFYGDIRYIDLHYDELRDFTKGGDHDHGEWLKFSGGSRFLDFLVLGTHAIFFVFLAFTLPYPQIFFLLFISLLIANIATLVYMIARNTTVSTERAESAGLTDTQILYNAQQTKTITGRQRDFAPRRWTVNNSIHVFFMGVFLYLMIFNGLNEGLSLLSLVVLGFTNCVVDFVWTWRFYFPKFDELPQPKQGQIAASG